MASTALITGASSGIGRELAWCFARDGVNLVLVARNEAQLNQLAQEVFSEHGVKVTVLVKDLTDSQAAAQIHAELTDRGIAVDVLVNNAGFGNHGKFAENDLQAEMDLIAVNITAAAGLILLFGKDFIKQGSGKILNVASVAAFQSGPLMANYFASKAYLLNLSDALVVEMRHQGVTVTTLCPGATVTEFFERASSPRSAVSKGMSAQTVAQQGYEGMLKGKRVVIPGWRNKLLVWAAKWSPRYFSVRIAMMVNRKI